ncbi:FAD binding domain-containing protein [Colletotrichum graminicola M1.001]|uniref:FAD binding domain-containing protein n=1 Tax=Colletotrichum graminicola (strain M1.001 / M2 / FGSC 10212) TaxID=645133 RepID=E3Q5F7_COLGM|nr:FAD binding domain-containing protein [Colletotrichum graminicola M1.001]EFQ25924.1 FAD binding domain-containing protein [Colletotrichum graminicola M1.001]
MTPTFIVNLLAVACLSSTATPFTASNMVSYRENGTEYDCKCSPADGCWPKPSAWDKLNKTVGGSLVRHIPPAAVCYNQLRGVETYDAAKCAEATANWADEGWQIAQPASQLWTWGSNNTCELPTDPTSTCTLGNYPEFVIIAWTRDHVKAGVDFAKSNNLRLVIRNTGHDFQGRSAGAGSLAINTHNLKDISFVGNYTGPGDYNGPAITIGAGVQGFEISEAAHARDPPQNVVMGECNTVGVAGGYIGGGGHGPLTSIYGFAADQALSFEVLTASGHFTVANSNDNPDLFYALKGGGPGNYGVVLSVTLKTFPDITPGAALFLDVNATTGANFEQVTKAVNKLHEIGNQLVDNGLYGIYELYPPALGGALHVQPIMGMGKTAGELTAVIQPLLSYLDAESIPYDFGAREYPDYYTLYNDVFEPEAAGQNGLTGGWVFTHEDMANNQSAIAEAIQLALAPAQNQSGIIVSHFFDPGTKTMEAHSAMHPRWRGATMRTMAILPQPLDATWDVKMALNDLMVDTITEKFKKAGPNGLAYVNENYAFMKNWQDSFWGPIYPELVAAKKKWDPDGVFFSWSTPGSEEWNVVDYANRLCKAR